MKPRRTATHHPALTDADRELLALPAGNTLKEIAELNIARKKAGLPMQFPPGWRTAVELKPLKPNDWPDEAA